MNTTFDQQMRRDQELIVGKSLDGAVRYFLERWAPRPDPDGPSDREFKADVIALVHRIYEAAQKPFVEAAARAMASVPIMPWLMSGAGGGTYTRAVMTDGSPVPTEGTVIVGGNPG